MITGASRGFGAEIAKAALYAGDQVVATARKVEALEPLGNSENLFNVAMDVTNEAQVKAAIDAALEHFGCIDVLVNNAGFGLLGAVEQGSAAEIENLYRTNVFGLLNVTRAVLSSMRNERSGHINMSSVGGYASAAGWGLYCSTKFAVEAIGEALTVEPGYFRTDFLDSSSLDTAKARISDYSGTVGKMREFAAGRNHQQPGDPQKLAKALVRLVRPPDPSVRLPLGTDTL